MTRKEIRIVLANSEEFFERSTRCLTEAESNFAPREGLFTAAQQMAHAAHSIEWFLEGARGEFDLDFEKHDREIRQINSLMEARRWMARAWDKARRYLDECSDELLMQPLPP